MDTTFTTELTTNNADAQAATPRARASSWAARLCDRAMFGSLLILIALVAIPYGTVEPWWVAVYECIVFALGVCWLGAGLITGAWGLSERRLLWPPLALVLFAFMQTVSWGAASSSGSGGAAGIESHAWRTLSVAPFETRLVAWKWLAFTLNGVLLLRYTSSGRRVRALIGVVIGVGVASALFGLVRQTMQGAASGFLLPALEPTSGYGQLINKNHFALLMEMTLGLTLGVMLGGSGDDDAGGVRRERWAFYAAAAFLMWAALVLTYSRGGIFSMCSQLVFLLVLRSRLRPTATAQGSQTGRRAATGAVMRFGRSVGTLTARAALIACLLLSLGVCIVWVGGDVLVTRLQALPDEVNAASAEPHAGVRRTEMWRATWQAITARPLVGSGFGAYGVAITKSHDASGKWTPEAAHNDFLELPASGGLIGVGLAVWFVFMLVKRARARLRSVDHVQRAACLGALTGLFGVAVHSFVDYGLHITINALVCLVLMVIATIDHRGLSRAPGERQGSARCVSN